MRYLTWTILSFILISFTTACVDRDFDAPPVLESADPDIPASDIITIAELKAMKQSGEDFTPINLDKYLEAIIVADDESGNFYKSLVVQDATGGLTILLDDVELWNRYYVGKKVYIDLSRIWLGDFNGLPQIGFEPYIDDSNRRTMARIPAVEINDIVLRGSNQPIPEAKLRTPNSLTVADLNTLVTIENVEFASGSNNTAYADAAGGSAVNHTIQDCNGASLIVRTSGFASFASELTPNGKGSITGIYGIFGSDKQILIRDLEDVKFTEDRCDGSSGGGGGPVEIDETKIVSIRSVLDQRIDGQETVIGGDNFLKGTVISSDETGNFYKTIVVQDETGGIALIVESRDNYVDYVIGSEVYVVLADLFISDYNGLPQMGYNPSTENVKRIPESLLSSIVILSGNVGIAPVNNISISEISDAQINTLVRINDVQFNDASTGNTYADADAMFAANNTLEDCDGNEIILRTSVFADFAGDKVADKKGTITGVLQVFNGTYQLYLNYPEKVDFNDTRCDGSGGGGGGTGGDEVYTLDFENQEDFDDVAAEGWMNLVLKGERVWIKRSFSSNGYCEATAFMDTNPETDTWLISPKVITNDRGSLSFLSSMAFYKHNGLSVHYTTDISDPANANWTNINATLANSSNENYDWVESGNIDLTSLGSEIYIGFHYEGTSSQNTTTYRLDDIKIQ